MEYTNEILIDVPQKQLVELLVNPELMKKWSPTLQSVELLEGKALVAGAKSKLIFDTGDSLLEMIETLTEIELPNIYNCLYESEGVKNWSNNTFSAVSPNQTKWFASNRFEFAFDISDREKKMIKEFSEQTRADMVYFKEYAEGLE